MATDTDTAPERIALALDTSPERIAFGVDDAAQAVGISRTTLYRWMDHGGLPYRQVGGRRLVIVCELRNWLAGQPRGGAT